MPSRLTILLAISSLLFFSHLFSFTTATATANDDDEDLSFLEAADDGETDSSSESNHHHHFNNDQESDESDDENYEDFDHEEGEEEHEDDSLFSNLDDNDVVVLTQRNFTDVIESNKYVMVEFYAPWCGHCKSLAPEYAAAATELKKENVTLAKIDATEDNELAEEYEVQGFPTVYFFVDGEHKPYNGPRTKEGLVTWIRKKIGPGINNITTMEDAERILTSENKIVLGFLNSLVGLESEELVAASKLDDDVNYYQTVNADVAKLFHIESITKRPTLVLLKREAEKVSHHDGQFTKSAIVEFVAANKLPLVTTFTRENAPSIFESPIKKQVLLFATSNDSEKVVPTFQEAAKLFKGKLIFVFVEMDNEEDGKPVADYFGITGNAPAVLGYTGSDDSRKYFIDGEITFEKIKAFGEDFLADKLKPFYKSDPIPEANDADVKVVVGNNFDEIVLDESKDVLLEVYAPWCGHCQSLEPAYNKLAKHLRAIDSLVIAKMDGTTNEHPRAKVEGFPTILFFPAGNKSSDPINVDSERTVVGLYKFLKKHASIPFKLQNTASTTSTTSTTTSDNSGAKEDIKSTTSENASKDEL